LSAIARRRRSLFAWRASASLSAVMSKVIM